MSSGDSGLTRASNGWRPVPLGMILGAGLLLTAWGDAGIRPLYSTLGDGSHVEEKLKHVDVAPIPGRVGQRIRNEMIFQSPGGGNPLPPNFRLEVVLNENLTSTLVRATGEAEGAIYSVQASF